MEGNAPRNDEQSELLRRLDGKLQQLIGTVGTINFILLVIFVLSLGNRFFGWNTPTIFQP
jgi:hypothetical protein